MTGKWDGRFVRMAKEVATWSKDPKRRVGAVLVSADRRSLSVGYNGFPRGVEDTEERLGDADMRRTLSVHAERNALDNAAFNCHGATLYTTYFPCLECVKGMVQKGVARIVSPPPDLDHPRWGDIWNSAGAMIREVNMKVTYYYKKSDAR